MKPAEAAKQLVTLADRVGRLTVLNSDPERFFLDRGEIEAELKSLALELSPSAAQPRPERGRFSAGLLAAKGRMVRVEVRRARKAAA